MASGRHKFTHEELVDAHKKQAAKLMHAKASIKSWKERAQAAEHKFEEYAFIDKKPDYHFSFSGHLIFRRWYLTNGLTALQAEFLVIISYTDVFYIRDLLLFRRAWIQNIQNNITKLIELGYIIGVKIPGTWRKSRFGYVLTQRGKDFETDYEKFYDKKMEEGRAGRFTPFNFSDGAYFRKIHISKYHRRKEQGGGMLPYPKKSDIWRDQHTVNEKT